MRQILEEDGIPCLVKNTDALGVIYGSLWTSPFAVQIFVLAGDEVAAQAALARRGFNTADTLRLPAKRRYKRRR